MYSQEIPPASRARLLQFSELFNACRDAFFDSDKREPASRSWAAYDKKVFEQKTGLKTNQILHVVGAYLEFASHQMGAMGAIYRCEEISFSPPVLARTVFENCARMMWVVGEIDPSKRRESIETSMDRNARGYLELIKSQVHAKETAKKFFGKKSAEYKREAQVLEKIETHARSFFGNGYFAETVDSPARLNGQKYANPTSAVAKMVKRLYRSTNATMPNEPGSGLYGWLSSHAHPNLSRLGRNDSRRESVAQDTIVVFYGALSVALGYMGWSFEHFDVLTRKIDDVFPTALTRNT